MIQALEAEMLYEGSNVSEDGGTIHRSETFISNVNEYFSLVQVGRIPIIPITNAHYISSMRNADGETLLIVAARLGHAKVVENLCAEIDVEEADNDGWTALLNASHEGHAECVSILLKAGASVDVCDLMGWTPLMWACYKNHPNGFF